MKIEANKENLSVRLYSPEEQRYIFEMTCFNIAHFYAVLYAIDKQLKGEKGDLSMLKPLKGTTGEKTTS